MTAGACVGHHPNGDVPAETGYLCYDHYGQLRAKLLQLPAISNWLHAHIAAGGQPGERISGSRDDPIPLRVDILDIIGPYSRKPAPGEQPLVLLWEDSVLIGVFTTWPDALHARWVEILDSPDIDAEPRRWQVRVTERGGTDQTGEESLRASIMYWARLIYDEARFPWTDRNDLPGLVQWITGHLDWVVVQSWVGDMLTELTRLTGTAHKLVPWRPETMRDKDPCDRCGVRAVVLHVAESTLRCEERLGGCGKATVSTYLKQATA